MGTYMYNIVTSVVQNNETIVEIQELPSKVKGLTTVVSTTDCSKTKGKPFPIILIITYQQPEALTGPYFP